MNVLDGTSSQRPARVAPGLDRGGRADDPGTARGDDTDLDDPPLDTGEAIGSPVGGLTVTIGYGPSLFDDRFGLAAHEARAPHRPAGPAERESGPGLRGRRPVHPGLLGRPAGRLPRCAEPGPSRARRRRLQLDGAGLRQDIVDEHRPGDPAEPARLQGRHPQHQSPTDRPLGRLRLGREGQRPSLDAGRQLPHRPPHPDLHRELGPGLPRRTSRTSSAGPR